MIEVTRSTGLGTLSGLIRVDHAAQISSPVTPYYVVEVICSDETVAKRGFNQHLIGKKKMRRFRHMSEPSQRRAHRKI